MHKLHVFRITIIKKGEEKEEKGGKRKKKKKKKQPYQLYEMSLRHQERDHPISI